jgi:hypothetical protein
VTLIVGGYLFTYLRWPGRRETLPEQVCSPA